MTMPCSFKAGLKAAQEVSPMNGAIDHLSTETLTSLRGELTLKTPSSAFILPFNPVSCSMRLVSSWACAARADTETAARKTSRRDLCFINRCPVGHRDPALFMHECRCNVDMFQF